MRLKRFWRHIRMSPLIAARAFSPATLDAIQHEIAAQEKLHRGEVCMVVEAELTSAQLWDDLAPRDRAREIFAERGVWNTEENNGVLLYVLLADRSVEIVADRGIDARVQKEAWHAICRAIEQQFAAARYQQGAIEGVRAISELLARHFPATGKERNELPDRPVIL
jgi:uncharacterized membrane protein